MRNLFIALAIASSCVVSGCGSSPPETISDLSPFIKQVDTNGDTTIIELRTKFGLSEKTYLFSTSGTAMRIAEGIKSHFPQVNGSVKFKLVTELSDALGNTTNENVINLSWSAATLKKINYDGTGFTSWGFMNLAEEIEYPKYAGRSIVKSYCQSSYREYADVFCSKAGW